MKSVHISTVRKMLARRQPVKITYVTRKGELQTLENAIPLSINFYGGYRNFKLPNGQIRRVRDTLIFAINDIDVFL